MNKKSHKIIRNPQKYIPFPLMDPIFSSTTYVFAKPGGLDSAFYKSWFAH